MGNGLKIGLLDFFSVHLNEPWNRTAPQQRTNFQYATRKLHLPLSTGATMNYQNYCFAFANHTTQALSAGDVLECEKIRNAVSGEFIFQETQIV